MRYLVGSFALVLALVSHVRGANLRIVGCDAVWTSTADPSPAYHVLVVNEQGATDRLSGWQMKLALVPTDGATGVLQFASADLPRQPTDDYLLAGDSATLDVSDPPPAPLIAGPVDSLLLGDYALSVVGGTVPSSEKMLLKADFTASKDARGLFAVMVVPGEENTFWASFDTTDCPTMIRGFGNVPLEGDSVVIGWVAVNMLVPEPLGISLLLAAFACGVGLLAVRSRGERHE
jgi:hypothetical protein